VEDQHWGQGIDEDLLCGGGARSTRRVEIAGQCLWPGEALQSVNNVVNIGGANVKLERLVRLQSDRILETWDTQLGT